MSGRRVITIDPPRKVAVSVPGFESVTVRAPTLGVSRRVSEAYARPQRVVARRFVDEVLASSLEPARKVATVASWPEPVRARLRLALVDAMEARDKLKALYSTHLTMDERVFAVMYWRWERAAAEMRRALAPAQRAARDAVRGFAGVRALDRVADYGLTASSVAKAMGMTRGASLTASGKGLGVSRSTRVAALGLERSVIDSFVRPQVTIVERLGLAGGFAERLGLAGGFAAGFGLNTAVADSLTSVIGASRAAAWRAYRRGSPSPAA